MPEMVTENPNRLGKWHKMATDGDQLSPAKFHDLFSARALQLRARNSVASSGSVNSVA